MQNLIVSWLAPILNLTNEKQKNSYGIFFLLRFDFGRFCFNLRFYFFWNLPEARENSLRILAMQKN